MVRSLIIHLSTSYAFASESGVLMQSQSNSDGALAMLGMNEQFVGVLQNGAGRVQKMQQTTAAMEDQYKTLLQNIVNSGSLSDPKTGTPYLPAESFLKAVESQFNTMRETLKTERDDNQQILGEAHNAVVKCNTDRNLAFTTDINGNLGVVKLLGTMTNARGEHKSCRNTEDGKIDDMEAKCAAFDALADKCSPDQDWYAGYSDASGGEGTLREVVSKATACKVAVEDTTATANECDGLQTDFKDAFCNYEARLSAVCHTHDECYTLQTSNLEGTRASVKALEKEQKTIWRLLGKVTCYLDALLAASFDNMPTQTTINNCNAAPIGDDVLNIEYKVEAAADACHTHASLGGETANSNYRPGKGNWYEVETTQKSGDLTLHNKLNADSQCR